MNVAPNTLAAASYDQNSIDELKEALAGPADVVDMKVWGLTAEQWREQIRAALEAKLADIQ